MNVPSSGSYQFDEKWGYSHGHVIGETGMVCNWSDVRADSLDMPTCEKGICGGHTPTDVLPFRIKVCSFAVRVSTHGYLVWMLGCILVFRFCSAFAGFHA